MAQLDFNSSLMPNYDSLICWAMATADLFTGLEFGMMLVTINIYVVRALHIPTQTIMAVKMIPINATPEVQKTIMTELAILHQVQRLTDDYVNTNQRSSAARSILSDSTGLTSAKRESTCALSLSMVRTCILSFLHVCDSLTKGAHLSVLALFLRR